MDIQKMQGMEKTSFYFDSRDGHSKIHAVRYTPEGEVVGVLQIIHGMSEYVERYEDLAQYFASRGFVVTGDDHLGHGKTVAEGGTYGYFCEQDPATVVVRDVHRLKKMTQELYPGLPYFILGHSMGSFILRNYLCRYGSGITGAIVMGTGMAPAGVMGFCKGLATLQKALLGSRHKANMLNALAFGGYNKRITGAKTPYDWLSVNRENVDRYIEDPLCGFTFTANGFITLSELILRLHDQENLAKVPDDLPLFFVSGGEDPVGEYGAGVQRAIASLKEAGLKDITEKTYPGDRHEILNEDDRDQVKEDLYQWVSSKMKTGQA